MSKQLSATLESVKNDFLNWRSSPNKSKTIPEVLWDKVILLLPHYKKRKILDILSLNHGQLKRKLKSYDTAFLPPKKINRLDQKNTNNFVQAIVKPSLQAMHYFDVVLTKPNGATLQIQKLSHDDIFKLTEIFSR